MMTYQAGDVVLVVFPFSEGGRAKLRPALVLFDSGDDDVVAARVTTQIHQSSFDVVLHEWRQAGLLAPSVVRLHKIATLEKSLIRRRLGRVQTTDRPRVAEVFTKLCSS